MQKYELLVQEDLSIGTSLLWVTAPGGGELYATQVGLHSFARGQGLYSATWSPGAIAAGLSATTTLAVPDAAAGDFVLASFDTMGTNSLRICGYISAAGTAKVVLHNPTAASITPDSGTVRVLVFAAAAPATTGTVTGLCLANGVTPVPNTTVDLKVDGVPAGSTTSDGNGRYTFSSVAAGTIRVDGTAPAGLWMGFTGHNIGALTAGQTLDLDITLNSI
jgi:hypothetical protein